MTSNRGIPFLMVAGISLTACAGIESSSSGVLERDSTTSVISVQTPPPPFGKGAAESRRIAYQEAKDHCAKQGKKMMIVNEASGPAKVNLTFQCASSEEQPTK